MESCPFSEVCGAAAKVDCDVPNMTGEHADEFPLRFVNLIVEAAKNAFGREGLIVLYEAAGESGGSEDRGVVKFGEPTATILKAPGLK